MPALNQLVNRSGWKEGHRNMYVQYIFHNASPNTGFITFGLKMLMEWLHFLPSKLGEGFKGYLSMIDKTVLPDSSEGMVFLGQVELSLCFSQAHFYRKYLGAFKTYSVYICFNYTKYE